MEPARGVNPEPPDGWPWALTAYEVEYVRAFNARPARPGWSASERDEARLDAEAEGVRNAIATPRRRTMRRAVVLAVAIPIALAGCGAATLGAIGLAAAAEKMAEAMKLEERIE